MKEWRDPRRMQRYNGSSETSHHFLVCHAVLTIQATRLLSARTPLLCTAAAAKLSSPCIALLCIPPTELTIPPISVTLNSLGLYSRASCTLHQRQWMCAGLFWCSNLVVKIQEHLHICPLICVCYKPINQWWACNRVYFFTKKASIIDSSLLCKK